MVNTGEFTIKSIKEQKEMALEELRFYHQELLKNKIIGSSDSSYLSRINRRMLFLIRFILKVESFSQKRTLKIINNRSYSTDKAKTYLFTTAGDYDVETALEIVKGASIINVTKEQTISPKIENLLLMANMLLDSDGFLTKDEITKVRLDNLSLGNNDISFPELTPSKSPYAPVGQLNPDIVEIIINSDSSVIPVALEQYKEGNRFHYMANIGENFNLTGIKSEYTTDILKIIYDELKRLKQEIWQKTTSSSVIPQLIGEKDYNLVNYQDVNQIKLLKNK